MATEELVQRMLSISKRPQTVSHFPQCGCPDCVLVSNVKEIAKAVHALAVELNQEKP